MTCFDDNQELIDEVMSYTPALARKRKQWDADFASAKANMMRRAGYDASLLKRIFNLFR